ncbi:EPS15-like proteiny (EH) domain and EF-hand domain pair-containing protein [Aphelenchoides besseyi]|nr:EPS15-like proteiny (EH) domain and EF-hand domain pair-containing protein [Aphelenchoides besseyi]KAI6201427.1 EPS15-like proteiny (EH) domain and EF-hand domain pair-containing protein [Aphelenchoides besseyi]
MWDHANKKFSWFTKNIGQNSASAQNGGIKSGIIPPALVQENRVPQFYRDAIVECGADSPNKQPNTNEVISMMWRSELTESVLNAIWNSISGFANTQLSRSEFYSCLVLIALAQKNLTIADLSALSSLPIPHLSSVKPKVSSLKRFKKDSVLSKPNGHLLKTLHPVFTETNVNLDDDLILFDANDSKPSPAPSVEKERNPVDLDLYSTTNETSSHKDLLPIWEQVITKVFELFSSIQQTNSKMLDAFYTEKGHLYLQSLYTIEQIVKRIYRSARECNSSGDLVSRCEILIEIWCNLYALLDDRISLEKRRELQRTEHFCNICGTQTNIDNTHFDKRTELFYHVSCANFWLNQVSGHLPGTSP